MLNNIKTTILGLVLAIALALEPIVQDGGFDIKKDWMRILIAVIIAISSYYTKDDVLLTKNKKYGKTHK